MTSRLFYQGFYFWLLVAGGCGGALIRVAPPGPGQVSGPAPQIREAKDLGGLPIKERLIPPYSYERICVQ